ncbi:MAG TPA: lipoyl synthase [Desulfonatronum sp.]|nr:lipoyl synthase [Desulfonatronum sp.]
MLHQPQPISFAGTRRKPPWLRVRLPQDRRFADLSKALRGLGLSTVCQSARCPNIGECFSNGTATFLILGEICTRGCAFCNIPSGRPGPPSPDEPERISRAVGQMGICHAVITSVTRDDLPDGGADHFARVISRLKSDHPGLCVEALVPDFQGDRQALAMVLESGVDILNHNVETVPELYASVRPGAVYRRSLELVDSVRLLAPEVRPKSGLILGLGETRSQVAHVLEDLARIGCQILTMGQYLPPSSKHYPVDRFLPPEEFEELGQLARKAGIPVVFSAPLVRSSYHAAEVAAIPNEPCS